MSLYLRNEARPAEWKDLDATQQRAFKTILFMIGEAVDGVLQRKSTFTEDNVEWLSGNRSSRTAVISGGRGTGKTTLLASLVKSTASRADPLQNNDMPENIIEEIVRIRKNMIWLEPLDMETTPSGANLLASILVRVEDAIKRLGYVGYAGIRDSGHEYMGATRLDHGSETYMVLSELQRVKDNIALAWEGNLQKRSGRIDPDAYAVELFRSENARLSLNNNLHEVLNKIATQIEWKGEIRNPLFILPVDDLDLNPLACLELLRLLRMISVPRLFSLILGDIYVAEVVMNLKLSGDLAQAANKGVRAPELISLRSDEIAAVAGEVSANAMRKLIPPNQRIVIENMTIAEALKFTPLDVLDESRSFKNLLFQYPMYFKLAPFREEDEPVKSDWNLKNYFLVPSMSLVSTGAGQKNGDKGDSERPGGEPDSGGKLKFDIEKSVYTGLNILGSTPRAISDLWFSMNRLIRLKKDNQKDIADKLEKHDSTDILLPEILHNRLVDAAADHCKNVLGEERGISPTQRIRFKESIRHNVKGNWEIGRMPLSVSCEVLPFKKISLSHSPDQKKGKITAKQDSVFDRSFLFNKGSFWNFEVKETFGYSETWGSSKDMGKRGFSISKEASSAIIIFHDLLAFGAEGKSFKSPLLMQNPEFLKLAGTVWQQDEYNSVELAWPLPPCISFWEFDIFVGSWNDAIMNSSTSTDENVEWEAFAWLSMGTAIVDRLKPEQTASPGYVENTNWKNVVSRLGNLSTIGFDNDLQNNPLEWLTSVFMMVMPETGLPDRICKPFFQSSDLRKYWIDHRESILPRRTIRLSTMVKNNLSDMAMELVSTTPDKLKMLKPSKEDIYKLADIELDDSNTGNGFEDKNEP